MLKKILRGFLITIFVLLLLLVIAGVGLYRYIDNNKDEAVRAFAEQLGLDLSYGDAELTAWSTWPDVTLAVDSVEIRDLKRPLTEKPLLETHRLDAAFNFSRIWDDTLRFESLQLSGGSFNMLTDSAGTYNLGALAGARDSTKSGGGGGSGPGLLSPVIDWEGVNISVRDFGARLIDSLKGKRFVTRFDSLVTRAETNANGRLQFFIELSTRVDGLAFNTQKGSYLRDTDLSTRLVVTRIDTAFVIDTTHLSANGDRYEFAGTVGRANNLTTRLYLANPATRYEHARKLLHDTLTVRMDRFDVEGTFPAAAHIISKPEYEGNVMVLVRFATDDQSVLLNGYRFTNVTTTGSFVNRLPAREGGSGSRKDFRIETEPTLAYYDGMRVETPRAIVRGKDNEPFLDAPIRMTGGTDALSRLFGNTNFFFTDGDFEMNTHVDASLMSITDIIGTSDGTLLMEDLDVDYQPAGVRFTFASLLVNKRGEDVDFALKSGDFPTSIDFLMEGYLDNILPLLIDRPADSIRTEIKFTAERLDWEGFRELVGQESYAENPTNATSAASSPASNVPPPPRRGAGGEGSSDAQIQSMKRTLLGLRNTFHPHLDIEIGKMAYYDVMELSDFTTGMHFEGDTMVLERTAFSWEDSALGIDAQFNMGSLGKTPFALTADADHLNLQQLRDPLKAFGLQLPRGIDSLPTDLRVRFDHTGIINDTFGIQPGRNAGNLDFSDSRAGLFEGHVEYAPENGSLRTRLELNGDPAVVNQLFAAEDFFFSSGNFNIDMDLVGVPEDVGELIESATLNLSIDSTNLRYEPAGAYVPIRHFEVNASDNYAEVDLTLTADATRRSVRLNGEMEGLSTFLYPERGETFRVQADATAGRLHASDIRTFVNFDAPISAPGAAGPTDPPAPFDPQRIFSASRGILNSFRPDLSLRIDTFDVDKNTQFRNVRTGIRMEDSTLLVVENTGFETDAGRVQLSGTYAIDRRLRSPFTLKWRTDSVYLDRLLLTARELGLPGIDSLSSISGIFATQGDVNGQLHEGKQRLLLNHSAAGIHLKTSVVVLDAWPQLLAIGKKALMKKRFQTVHLAPLDVQLRIDSGTVHIPRTEIQSSPLQLFVQGEVDTLHGTNLLITLPLKNISRGVLNEAPPKTGFAHAGWKVYLVMEPGKDGKTKIRFRLGRRKYYKDRGRLAELRELRRDERKARRKR